MASFRPYRPALGLEKAIEELRRQSGMLYDARVVQACIVMLSGKGFDFETKAWKKHKPV
jgi:HD-GYP domain-containing protein (c-di-GMP phosphodiesterase class II)